MSLANNIWARRSAEFALLVGTQVALYYTVRWALDTLQDSGEKAKKSKAQQILSKMGKKDLDLSPYERTIAAGIILPDEIEVGFTDIGGLEPIISSLRESVIFPLLYPSLFTSSSSLLGAPKGVLLYGPPGCGKTMLAKALARESGATFINLSVSSMANKWYGESNQLVAAVFGLARKLQPAIIFMDEIDAFLRERSKGDHEVTGQLKAEFMTLWDGLTSGADRILVLGATNRPEDIDEAMLRRMPKRYAVGLPNREQRTKILSLMLKDTRLAPDFSIERLAAVTDGLSGSDLKEACRNAAMLPVREYLRQNGSDPDALRRAQQEGFTLRPLTHDDFLRAEAQSVAFAEFPVQPPEIALLD
ncbi:AAA-domain-containing protein [Auricularia subglabra TFB-10046 SS5]|nr:AAA-domain-containing protein [Auricularia subglabra TFB-10046 SS5]